MATLGQGVEGVVVSFLTKYSNDKFEGGVRSLSEYQAFFLGYEKEIEAEYNALQQEELHTRTVHPADCGEDDGLFTALSDPEAIGPYRVLERIGRGGMGVVYLAEQREPVRRRVAIKVIKHGMDTKEVLARFELEHNALTLMNHSSIARFHEAGATPEGRPYFVMEYVPGVPVGDYCDRECLTVKERLELFILLCQAVQHAHQKGVIHRDLKPSNILVAVEDGEAVPKIIDFGVARATSQTLLRNTVYTELGRIVGTPAYMSPEQAEMTGADIDSRTDLYSLGVILYELLAGVLPFEPELLRSAGYAEIQRIVREVTPLTPSARLGSLREDSHTAAARRRTDRKSLIRRIRGDLDWITMKALDKDRMRRYDSASELALDVRRHLENEPVLARPPSTLYRLGKLARKHRTVAITVSVVLLSLAGGLVAASYGLWEAQRQTKIANDALAESNDRAQELSALVNFQGVQLAGIDLQDMGVHIRDSVVEAARRKQVSGDDERDREASLVRTVAFLDGVNFTDVAASAIEHSILSRASKIVEGLPLEPATQARLIQNTCFVATRLGRIEQALKLQWLSYEKWREAHGDDHADTLFARNNIGYYLLRLDRANEAEPHIRQALKGRRQLLGDGDVATLQSFNNLGNLLRRQQRFIEAEECLLDALQASRTSQGDENSGTIDLINDLGVVYWYLGKFTETERLWKEALETRRRLLKKDDRALLVSISNMGLVNQRQGDYSEAERYFREAWEIARVNNGGKHPDTLGFLHNLGSALISQEKYSEAEPLMREAFGSRLGVFGPEHSATLESAFLLGLLLRGQRRFEEASILFKMVIDSDSKAGEERKAYSLAALHHLGVLYYRTGMLFDAERCLSQALAGRRTVLKDQHLDTIFSIHMIGTLRHAQWRLSEAEKLARQSFVAIRETCGEDHVDTIRCCQDFGSLLLSMSRIHEAEALLLRALESSRQLLGEEHPQALRALHLVGRLRAAQERSDEAEACLRQALNAQRRTLGEQHTDVFQTMVSLGKLLRDLRLEEASQVGAEAINLGREAERPRHWLVGNALLEHGQTLLRMKSYSKAVAELEEAYSIYLESFGRSSPRIEIVVQQLVSAYEAWDRMAPGDGHRATAMLWKTRLKASEDDAK